tara:strand:- start:393 stop:593 length:201 start_codon:yes stop_codon:yes gene_type:complete
MLKLILAKVGNDGRDKVISEWNSDEHGEVFKHLDYGQGPCHTIMFDPDANAEIEYVVTVAETLKNS